MAKKQSPGDDGRIRPALTPESEENKMIALAVNLAKQQLIDGTASSQVITHFLKLASTREKMEQELLSAKVELAKANVELIESNARKEELYEQAIKAFKLYRGDDEL